MEPIARRIPREPVISGGQFKFFPPQVVVRFHSKTEFCGYGAGSRLVSRKQCFYYCGASHSYKDTDIRVVAATESPSSKKESSQFLAKLSKGNFPRGFARTSNSFTQSFPALMSKIIA